MTLVTAARLVPAPAAVLYGFLEHLPNHERLTGHRLRLIRLAKDRPGARMEIRGPFGVRRTADTTITYRHAPYALGGTARTGRRTTAEVHWSLDPAGDNTLVTLTAVIHRAGPLDRLLLAVGRRWLAGAFDHAIRSLTTAAVCSPGSCPAGARLPGPP